MSNKTDTASGGSTGSARKIHGTGSARGSRCFQAFSTSTRR